MNQLPRLRARDPQSHKGDYGRVLVVAGSRSMPGAAMMTAMSALRSGAGLVHLAVPSEIQTIASTANPCYTTVGLPQDLKGRLATSACDDLIELITNSHSLAFGPGVGSSGSIVKIVRMLIEKSNIPIVLDADGLNALCQLEKGLLALRSFPTILTPHPGEFARMIGSSTPEVQQNRQLLAENYAREHKIVLVLKGHETIVTDGHQTYINHTGNPGMATGGSGDVLTGVIVALIKQVDTPFEAAVLGTYVHGLAGDMAASEFSQISLIASDIISYLPKAFKTYLASS